MERYGSGSCHHTVPHTIYQRIQLEGSTWGYCSCIHISCYFTFEIYVSHLFLLCFIFSCTNQAESGSVALSVFCHSSLRWRLLEEQFEPGLQAKGEVHISTGVEPPCPLGMKSGLLMVLFKPACVHEFYTSVYRLYVSKSCTAPSP